MSFEEELLRSEGLSMSAASLKNQVQQMVDKAFERNTKFANRSDVNIFTHQMNKEGKGIEVSKIEKQPQISKFGRGNQ